MASSLLVEFATSPKLCIHTVCVYSLYVSWKLAPRGRRVIAIARQRSDGAAIHIREKCASKMGTWKDK
jgi:hypothetical protein